VVCGFVSTPHFSKCYRECFGIPPSDERLVTQTQRQVTARPIAQALSLASPMSLLDQARDESTFASIKFLKS